MTDLSLTPLQNTPNSWQYIIKKPKQYLRPFFIIGSVNTVYPFNWSQIRAKNLLLMCTKTFGANLILFTLPPQPVIPKLMGKLKLLIKQLLDIIKIMALLIIKLFSPQEQLDMELDQIIQDLETPQAQRTPEHWQSLTHPSKIGTWSSTSARLPDAPFQTLRPPTAYGVVPWLTAWIGPTCCWEMTYPRSGGSSPTVSDLTRREKNRLDLCNIIY